MWSVKGGKCWKHDNDHFVFNDEQRQTSGRVRQVKATGGKLSEKMAEQEEEETKEDTDRTSSGAKRKANGAASRSHTSGHAAPAKQQPQTATPGSSPPFIVTLTAAEHTWDDIVNSTYHIALPAPSSSSTTPFPPPNDLAPPSDILRSHVLSTAFPLYPISEPNLLLVFSDPLTLLSFPPWLQRLCELDNRPARHAAVWTRREFEQVIERYSTTVQRAEHDTDWSKTDGLSGCV